MYHALDSGGDFCEDQGRDFMSWAINEVGPIIRLYKAEMAQAVEELEREGRVCGERIRRILGAT